MEDLLLGMKSQLDEMTKKLNKLEADNATLRNELFGVGVSVGSNEESMGILEKKTLRQVVEEIRFDVKAVKDRLELEGAGTRSTPEKVNMISCTEQKEPLPEQKYDLVEKSVEEYPVIDIERKTIEKERKWMKSIFQEARRNLSDPADGASLMGKTVETISSSIKLSEKVGSSIVLKISNHLSSTVTSPQLHIFGGKQISDPKNIIGHTCEAFSFEGCDEGCGFLLSLRISSRLRLAILCLAHTDGKVTSCVAFTAENIRTDVSLLEYLGQIGSATDIWAQEAENYDPPLEAFVKHGKLVARVRTTVGPQCVVHADILEVRNEFQTASRVSPKMKATITDGISLSNGNSSCQALLEHFDLAPTCDSLVCIVEIVNCLNVSLESSRRYVQSCNHNNFMPAEVLPFTREIFFASGNEIVEAIFAYEIDTTDLGLVVAFRVQASNNTVAAALIALPEVTDEKALKFFMDPKQWKTHHYKIYANAKDEEQKIQARNIRATVRMSETQKSSLKICVFAV